MILIITDPAEDGHWRPVTVELRRRGADFCTYDPGLYPAASQLTLESTATGVVGSLAWQGKELALDAVTSVWYRRPGDVVLSDRLTVEEQQWLRSECQHLFRATWTTMRTLWVSEPDAIRRASVKVTQLRLAMELGFSVPRFTITNDVDRAAAFIRSCQSGTIVKVLALPHIVYPDKVATIYTHLVTAENVEQLDAVKYGPTFLQEYVVKKMDVRVTVIGVQLFAVGIHSTHTEESRVDFRRAEIYDLPHTVLSLPDRISALCIEMVHRLGLNFGAIDLVLTASGDYEFLEINPNGQWYWLEQITDAPLTAAMCDLLTSGATSSHAP